MHGDSLDKQRKRKARICMWGGNSSRNYVPLRSEIQDLPEYGFMGLQGCGPTEEPFTGLISGNISWILFGFFFFFFLICIVVSCASVKVLGYQKIFTERVL